MTAEQIEQILDLTHPNWRTIDPMKFKTFEEYVSTIRQLVDEGAEKLGITLDTVH